MIAGCSAAWDTKNSVSQYIGCSVVGCTEGFGFQDIDCSVVGGTECFGDTFLVGFAYHHPSPLCALPHSYRWGNVVHMSLFL